VSLDTRARTAAEGLRVATAVDTEAGLARLRRTHGRRNAARVAAAGVGIAVTIALLAGTGLVGNRGTAEQAPAGPPSSTVSPSTAIEPGDTKTWTTYTSDQYGFRVGHPPDWTVIPASRGWRSDVDTADWLSSAHDTFQSPGGDVLVSVWNVPLDSGTSIDSIADIEAWVETYCEESSNTPCAGIDDRAVELCLENRDCHPGLLVPFANDVQAFFDGGNDSDEAGPMTVLAVWRPESHRSTAPYGGSQRLLEAFLSTMQVWPASTPFEERLCYGGPPGLTC